MKTLFKKQTSKMESFATIAKVFYLSTIVARLFTLDVCEGSDYASA